MKDFLKKGKAKSNDSGDDSKEKPAKKPLFGGSKSDKSAKKGGGLGFGKKPSKAKTGNDSLSDDDFGEKPAFSLKNNKGAGKPKKGKGGGLDLSKMDTKKLIMGLVAVLVVLVLLLVATFVIGGGDESSELPPPEMASEQVSEPAPAPMPESPPAETPPPAPEQQVTVEAPPTPTEPAPVAPPAPVEQPPVAVAPPPAQQPVQVAPQPQQAQPAGVSRPATAPMTREEFESGADKIYRERTTTPPTSSRWAFTNWVLLKQDPICVFKQAFCPINHLI